MKNNLIIKLYRVRTVKRVEDKIKLLGVSSKFNTLTFLNIQFLLTVLVFLVTFFISDIGYVLAPLLALLTYYLVYFLALQYPIIKRGKKLEKEAIFFFEILGLTLESGRTLKHALDLTATNIDSELSEEFKQCLAEVKLGKSLNESLESLKLRIPSDAINNTILNILQSSSYGNSVVDSIYHQIDYLRDKQILDVKAEIAKLPTKVSIISVLFFVPIMLLIILAPVLINFLLK